MTQLKTLKDMEHSSCSSGDKTCIGDDYCESYTRADLKQESIKWINKLNKKLKQFDETGEAKFLLNYKHKEDSVLYEQKTTFKCDCDDVCDCGDFFEPETIYTQISGTIRWIKHFFNITDKDLELEYGN